MLLAVLEAAQQGLDRCRLIAARYVIDSQTKRRHLFCKPVLLSINGSKKWPARSHGKGLIYHEISCRSDE